MILSREFLLNRGKCCGNGCLNCPYFPKHKRNNMVTQLQGVQEVISLLSDKEKELISDGYHTFKELYEFRKVYNAALFNEWAKGNEGPINCEVENSKNSPMYDVHKSWRHHDGQLCFGGGWFIVVAILPTGQISNHYKAEDWDLFKIPEVEKAKYPFDGHTYKIVTGKQS